MHFDVNLEMNFALGEEKQPTSHKVIDASDWAVISGAKSLRLQEVCDAILDTRIYPRHTRAQVTMTQSSNCLQQTLSWLEKGTYHSLTILSNTGVAVWPSNCVFIQRDVKTLPYCVEHVQYISSVTDTTGMICMGDETG